MKTTNPTCNALALKSAVAAAVLAVLMATAPAHSAGRNPNPGVLTVGSSAFGNTLAEWSAEWWKRGIEHPVEGSPFVTGGCFELSGNVIAFAAPLSTATLSCTVPAGKALFVAGLTIECSSLEPEDSGFHGDTEEEQAECATYWADHIVDMGFEIDGVPVNNVASYRVVSPQFSYTAPDPNILGVPGGGSGTAVADGYYLMLAPLSKGGHTIRIHGTLHFAVAEGDPFDLDLPSDVTFNITVE
jgi:hypothetical protein